MLIQYLAIAILIAIIAFAFYDIKSAILLWLPFKLLFNNQIAVRYAAPGMSLVIAVDFALFLIYIIRKHKADFYEGVFVFKKPLIAIAISYIVSLIFTIAPYSTAIIATVKDFISGFAMVYLAHVAFQDLNDIKLFLKSSIIVAILIVALAISENLLKTNIWLDFVYYNSPFDPTSGRMFYTPGHLEMRYGLVRSRAFFGFHIPFGYACLCLYWMVYYFSRFTDEYINNKLLTMVALLLIAGVIMSNSKQIYLGLIIIIFSLYPIKSIFNVKIILPLLLTIVAIAIYFPEYLNNIFSLTDEDLAEEGGGSTISMREEQFEIALNMFKENPIIGNGIASISQMKQNYIFEGIRGAESAWLRILPERGILGAITYIYLYICLWKENMYMEKKMLFFFLLAILTIEAAGGLKDLSIWGTAFLCVYRYQELKSIEN